MTARRFIDKWETDPWAVNGLPPGHEALARNRTLFPGTVVMVTAETPDRLLVSGRNNRKLGATVAKGAFAGYALYGLSLEERATCPSSCSVIDACYGNGMPLARRHRIGDRTVFFDRLDAEIRALLNEHETGVLIRLHVLGDFPDVEYVAFWSDVLADHVRVACYGYTHRKPRALGGDDIGEAIKAVKAAHPERFRIRWSDSVPRSDGAVVIGYEPRKARAEQGLVCPAQRDATASCSTCGLCWEPAFRHDTVAFIKHGPKSREAAAVAAMRAMDASADRTFPHGALTSEVEIDPAVAAIAAAVGSGRGIGPAVRLPLAPPVPAPAPPLPLPKPAAAPLTVASMPSPAPVGETRPVRALDLPSSIRPNVIASAPPQIRMVAPTSLRIEATYQRDLSGPSIALIRKVVQGWDWRKFKPPICAETREGLFVIDGQHTAIAAASHPAIQTIPVLVVQAEQLTSRADAFVAHNRDRLAMSPFQLFHAEAAAGSAEANAILHIAAKAGAFIPRNRPMKRSEKVGQIVPVAEVRRCFRTAGPETLARILRIAVLAKQKPLVQTVLRGIWMICREPYFATTAILPDTVIAAALESLGDADRAARAHAAASEQSRDRACAVLIAEAARKRMEAA